MSAFQAAYAKERAAYRAASHIFALEYRVNRRFRLWERPKDDPVGLALDARIACRHDLRAAREDAASVLDALWDGYSRSLPPLTDNSEGFILPRTICAQRGEGPEWYAAIRTVLWNWNNLSAGWW